MKTVIKVENIYKEYRLGSIGYGTLREDMVSWWARINGRPDPNSIIGENTNDKNSSDRILALNNINFEVKQGERLGIIGPNGAGKTTLLKILSQISSPAKGAVYIRGRVASLISVGTGFHPELTGRENIFLNGAILGLRKFEINDRLDEIIDFSGVEKFIDTPIKRYSSGMKIRLGFSVAAHLDPDILIIDEVLAVGDAEFKKKAMNKMDAKTGESLRTILFVSHDLDSIRRLCTKCLLIDKGELIMLDNVNKTIDHYLKEEQVNKSSKWICGFNKNINLIAYLIDAKIINHKKVSTNMVDITEKVGIFFTFKLQENQKQIIPSISVYNNSDIHLFSAIDTDKNWADPKLNGEYKCIAWIPGNLLKEGEYYISIQLLTPASGGRSISHFKESKILNFSVFDHRIGKSSIGVLNVNWNCMIMPMLEWDIVKEG